jgi:probable DNA metabolism protein
MIVYEIENSLEGVLTAIFDSYLNKEVPDIVTSSNRYQARIDSVVRLIKTDNEKAERVKRSVMKYSSEKTIDMARVVMRSSLLSKSTVVFNYLRKIIEEKREIALDLGSSETVDFNEIRNKVMLENHRHKGFLRFSETTNGVLYAHFTPDNDIIELLVPHFVKRFKYRAFAIHDIRRNKLALYDKKKVVFTTPTEPISVYVGETELECRSLFKNYFDAVNIKSRKNTRQQRGYLPLRYTKNMTEFN